MDLLRARPFPSCRLAFAAASVAVVVSGCAANSVSPSSLDPFVIGDGFTRADVEVLQEPDLSSHQQAVLRRALETARVEYIDYETAQSEEISCLEDAGLTIVDYQVVDTNGQPIISYGMTMTPGMTDEEFDSIYFGCSHKYLEATESLYLNNPGANAQSIEETETRFRQPVTACLEAHGYSVDPTVEDDWLSVIGQVLIENLDEGLIQCVVETGFLDGPRVLPLPPGYAPAGED